MLPPHINRENHTVPNRGYLNYLRPPLGLPRSNVHKLGAPPRIVELGPIVDKPVLPIIPDWGSQNYLSAYPLVCVNQPFQRLHLDHIVRVDTYDIRRPGKLLQSSRDGTVPLLREIDSLLVYVSVTVVRALLGQTVVRDSLYRRRYWLSADRYNCKIHLRSL